MTKHFHTMGIEKRWIQRRDCFYYHFPKMRKIFSNVNMETTFVKRRSLSSYVRVRHFARQSCSESNPFLKSGTTVSTLESRHCVEIVSLDLRDFPSTIPRVVQGALIFINSPSRFHLSLVVDTLAKPSHFSLLLHFHRARIQDFRKHLDCGGKLRLHVFDPPVATSREISHERRDYRNFSFTFLRSKAFDLCRWKVSLKLDAPNERLKQLKREIKLVKIKFDVICHFYFILYLYYLFLSWNSSTVKYLSLRKMCPSSHLLQYLFS